MSYMYIHLSCSLINGLDSTSYVLSCLKLSLNEHKQRLALALVIISPKPQIWFNSSIHKLLIQQIYHFGVYGFTSLALVFENKSNTLEVPNCDLALLFSYHVIYMYYLHVWNNQYVKWITLLPQHLFKNSFLSVNSALPIMRWINITCIKYWFCSMLKAAQLLIVVHILFISSPTLWWKGASFAI